MRLVVLPGDGIGPEITAATLEVLGDLDARWGLGLQFEEHAIGLVALAERGTTLPDEVLARVGEVGAGLLGPVSHADYPSPVLGGVNPSAALRVGLDLYANVRPCRSYPGLSYLRDGAMDLVIVRENTEGFYADRNMFQGSGEFMPDADTALSVRKITRRASTRVATRAFELARTRRGHVTIVHKANVLRVSDGLFADAVRDVATSYPEVRVDELFVDAAAAALVRDPEHFDVIVTTNMFGDILSDEASQLSGSLGVGGSLNVGDSRALAQAQHGSAPDIAGRGVANPASLILSAAMLLAWGAARDDQRELAGAADTLTDAVTAALSDPGARTPDLGGTATTDTFTARVREELRDERSAP